MNKVFMIMGDIIAHDGHAFHPRIAEPLVSIKDDGEGGEEGEEQENSPSMDPSAMQGLVVSALTTASAATSSQFPYQNVEMESSEMNSELQLNIPTKNYSTVQPVLDKIMLTDVVSTLFLKSSRACSPSQILHGCNIYGSSPHSFSSSTTGHFNASSTDL